MNDATLASETGQARQDTHSNTCPLVLDFDETLLRPAFLIEMALAYIKPNPLRALHVLWWLVSSWNARWNSDLAREV